MYYMYIYYCTSYGPGTSKPHMLCHPYDSHLDRAIAFLLKNLGTRQVCGGQGRDLIENSITGYSMSLSFCLTTWNGFRHRLRHLEDPNNQTWSGLNMFSRRLDCRTTTSSIWKLFWAPHKDTKRISIAKRRCENTIISSHSKSFSIPNCPSFPVFLVDFFAAAPRPSSRPTAQLRPIDMKVWRSAEALLANCELRCFTWEETQEEPLNFRAQLDGRWTHSQMIENGISWCSI
jgi:hypothetical protein